MALRQKNQKFMQDTKSSPYRVEVVDTDAPNWQEYPICGLGISIGAHYHESDKFNASLNWIGSNFQKCEILLCDTLHRYNYDSYNKDDEKTALLMAKQRGDQWIERNSKAIISSPIPINISRWDEWLSHNDYKDTLTNVKNLWLQNKSMQNAINTDVMRYIENNSLQKSSRENSIENGTNYLLEELAGLSLFYKYRTPLELYIGPQIKALTYLKNDNPLGVPDSLLKQRYIKISFKRAIQTS